MNTIALGSLMIRADILIFLISAAAGFFVLKWRLRRREESAWILDMYVNVLLIGFLAWKFSMIVFDPVRTFRYPMSLLYFTGGDKGVLLGTVLALAYIGFRLNRKKEWTGPLIRAAALAYVAGGFTKHALILLWSGSFDWTEALNVVLCGFFMARLWLTYNDSFRSLLSQALWFSIASVMIPFFKEDRHAVFAGFTSAQIAFSVIAIILLLVETVWMKKNDSFKGHL